jgi:hypothetical protein
MRQQLCMQIASKLKVTFSFFFFSNRPIRCTCICCILDKNGILLVQTNPQQHFLALLASVCNLYKQCKLNSGFVMDIYKVNKSTYFSYKRSGAMAAIHSQKR